jgi:hypothetical protein
MFHAASFPIERAERLALSDLQRHGVHVVESFFSRERCARIRGEIESLLERYRNNVWVDSLGSDHRVYGADRVSRIVAPFYADGFITRIVQRYEGSHNIVGFTVAGKLVHMKGNSGSGGGWHRDRADRRQIKAMIYLSDVDECLGPFQYLLGSHRPLATIKDVLKEGFGFNQNRFDNSAIDELTRKAPGRMKIFTARMGALLLVDSRGIHRGMPMTRDGGTRYALTNYYWSDAAIPEHIQKLLVA